MHFTTMDLCKCAPLILNPLYFREYDILIVNMLLYCKPDDYGRNLTKQTRYSCRNVMTTQTREGPQKLSLLVET